MKQKVILTAVGISFLMSSGAMYYANDALSIRLGCEAALVMIYTAIFSGLQN